MSQSLLNNLIETATTAFDGRPPQTRVRLPNPLDKDGIFGASASINPSALWTRDGSRPRWDNLAAVAESIPDQSYLDGWTQALRDLSIPLGVLSVDQKYTCLSWSVSGELKKQTVEPE